MKDPVKVARGRSARTLGADFERRVRIDLEEKGWIVDKWNNQVQFITSSNEKGEELIIPEETKLVPAKHKFQQNGIPFAIGTGFPDFIGFRPMSCSTCYARMGDISTENHKVVGVECKVNGKLSKEEKEKCKWLIEKKIFSRIYIAEKTKEKGKIVIVYHTFEEKYGKK